MSEHFTAQDVKSSLAYLGFSSLPPDTYIELLAFNRHYKRGKEHYHWNREHDAFPKNWYVNAISGVFYFLKKFGEHHTTSIGINPRHQKYTNDKGYVRAAVEGEIKVCQNIFLDFDFKAKKVTNEHIAAFELFLHQLEEYLNDMHIHSFDSSFSGQGYHGFIPLASIYVSECPDISERIKEFQQGIRHEFDKDLNRLEVILDNTADLARKVKIPGTKKPEIGILSKWYGGDKRVEDQGMRDYLLTMSLPEPSLEKTVLNISRELPQWFEGLVRRDSKVKALWEGYGKTDNTDSSNSGYDFSLVKLLLSYGFKNVDELATVLAHRPNGVVQTKNKDERYLQHTIANAILK